MKSHDRLGIPDVYCISKGSVTIFWIFYNNMNVFVLKKWFVF